MRTPRRDFWMRLGLASIAIAMAVNIWVTFDKLIESSAFSILLLIVLSLSSLFTMFLVVNQIDPVVEGTLKIIFTPMDLEMKENDKWRRTFEECKEWCDDNVTWFWCEFKGVHYFLFKKDAVLFKLAWYHR